MSNLTIKSGERFLRMKYLIQKVGLSQSQIYNLLAKGRFPPGLYLSPGVRVWTESSIETWMAECLALGFVRKSTGPNSQGEIDGAH